MKILFILPREVSLTLSPLVFRSSGLNLKKKKNTLTELNLQREFDRAGARRSDCISFGIEK